MKSGAYLERYIDAVACLRKSPRTVRELCEVVSMSEVPMIRLVKAMHAEGLIEPFGMLKTSRHQGAAATVWMWKS